MAQFIFTLVAIAQGCFVLGLTVFIFGYYMPKSEEQRKDKLRWHVVFVAGSYVLLTAATVFTSMQSIWTFGSIWYWIVGIGYLMGDVSLFYLFRMKIAERKYRELMKKQQDDRKKENDNFNKN